MTELERCDDEIQNIQRLLLAGHPDLDGLLLGLSDWRAERQLLINAANEEGQV